MLLTDDFLSYAVNWNADQSNSFVDKLIVEWEGLQAAGQQLFDTEAEEQERLEKYLLELTK
jgi:hypothetical protein